MAVVHDARAMLTAATPRTSPVNSKGSNGATERAVQSADGMARTLRLDLLRRTNILDGETRGMVVEPFPSGTAYGKMAYARQFEKPCESPVLPLAERVMCTDPTLQPA